MNIYCAEPDITFLNYFQKNISRMEYDIYREQGFPIGSGLVDLSRFEGEAYDTPAVSSYKAFFYGVNRF